MRPLAHLYYNLGKFNSRHPILVISLCVLVTVGFSTGFAYLGVATDPQKLWVDPDSRSHRERAYFNAKFGKFFRVNQAVFYSKHDPEHTDVFQKEFLQEI